MIDEEFFLSLPDLDYDGDTELMSTTDELLEEATDEEESDIVEEYMVSSQWSELSNSHEKNLQLMLFTRQVNDLIEFIDDLENSTRISNGSDYYSAVIDSYTNTDNGICIYMNSMSSTDFCMNMMNRIIHIFSNNDSSRFDKILSDSSGKKIHTNMRVYDHCYSISVCINGSVEEELPPEDPISVIISKARKRLMQL